MRGGAWRGWGRRMAVLALAAGVAGGPGAIEAEAVGRGDISAQKFFPASGFALGEQRRLAGRLLGEGWLRDLEAEEYLRRVTRALAPSESHFVIVANEDAVNAFAYLGGIVVVYRGLWQFARDEDGFVGVVAHELAHVRLDHVRKTRENAELVSALTTPVLIGGLLIDDPEVREAVVAGSAGLISGDIIAYSRELEHEADVAALGMLRESPFDPRGMARIFARFSSGGVSEYLSTHPAPERRGAYLADRLHDAPARVSGGWANSLDFYLLRVKLGREGVVERDYKRRQRAALAKAATPVQEVLARYGLLLAATKTRDAALGAEMSAALARYENPLIARAVAENRRQRGELAAALEGVRRAAEAAPERASLAVEWLRVLERLGRHRRALEVFEGLPEAVRETPAVLLAVGRSAALAGQRFLSNYYLARGHAQDGNFEQARKQIAIAERFRGRDTKRILALAALKKAVARELKLLAEQRVLDEG